MPQSDRDSLRHLGRADRRTVVKSPGIVRLIERVPATVAKKFHADSRLTRLIRPLANRLVPTGETTVTVQSGAARGLQLPVNLKSEKFYWTGVHEQHVQSALERELGPGMIFWDIGAHIGFMSTIAARLVGETGRVISLEPMPDTAARLRRAVDLNELDNVTIIEAAVADQPGKRKLRPPRPTGDPSHGVDAAQPTVMWTLVEDRGASEGITVECVTLDGLATEFERPDLVKVDAEGAEAEVLEGGLGLLESRTTRVLIEISDKATLSRVRELLPDRRFEHLGANHYLLA